MLPQLSFSSHRRFGVELEVNAFDGLNRPPNGKKYPTGIEDVSVVVAENTEEGCRIEGYQHTEKNDQWVLKMDSSCGMEVVSPPLKGWEGISKVCKVAKAFNEEPKIKSDERCSVHIHVEVADLTETELASVLIHWVKCEPCFMDAMPLERKRNRYCQFIGLMPIFQHDDDVEPKKIITDLGTVKYYSVNTNQMVLGSHRKTIEFRVIEGDGSRNPYLLKNWIRLIIHFVEMTKKLPLPSRYKEGDRWSSYLWLEPEDILTILGFNNNYELSKGLTQTRNWLIARWAKNLSKHQNPGLPRYVAWKQVQDILKNFGVTEQELEPDNLDKVLFCENLRY